MALTGMIMMNNNNFKKIINNMKLQIDRRKINE